jgi:hypothetical protein
VGSAVVIGVLLILKNGVLRLPVSGIHTILKPAAWLLVVLLTTLSLVINLSHYRKWNREKTHTVYQISHELGARLNNAYIAGLTAPVAVLENTHRSLFLYPEFVNWDRHTFERYALTHALLASFNQEITLFFRQWPDQMEQARLLKVYNIKDQFLHLYSFVAPFIEEAREIDNQGIELKIQNPSDNPVMAGIGSICFFNDSGGLGGVDDYSISEATDSVVLKPGENRLVLPHPPSEQSEPLSVLFFLDLKEWGRTHRYQAEKFPLRAGENIRNVGASGGYTRSFFQKKHRAGFITFGPFIPYSTGFLKVDFNLKFDRVRSRIRPLVKLDIFSYSTKQSLDRRVLKPGDIRNNDFNRYPLTVTLPHRHFLEFRVYAEQFADIDLDYVDVVYYQGYILNLNHDEGRSLLAKKSFQGGTFGDTK